MFTITYRLGECVKRIAVDLRIEAELDNYTHDRVVAYMANHYPNARILGYHVYPIEQRQQWEEMRDWIAKL